MDGDSIQDVLNEFLTNHNVDSDTCDNLLDIILDQGIDLSIYTPDELSDALEYALQNLDSTPQIIDNSNPTFLAHSDNIPSEIQRDIDYYEGKLREANRDIDYYTKQLGRSGISDTYRNNCKSSLKSAINNSEDYSEKIRNLYKKYK